MLCLVLQFRRKGPGRRQRLGRRQARRRPALVVSLPFLTVAPLRGILRDPHLSPLPRFTRDDFFSIFSRHASNIPRYL